MAGALERLYGTEEDKVPNLNIEWLKIGELSVFHQDWGVPI
jgi:hypothetical protein